MTARRGWAWGWVLLSALVVIAAPAGADGESEEAPGGEWPYAYVRPPGLGEVVETPAGVDASGLERQVAALLTQEAPVTREQMTGLYAEAVKALGDPHKAFKHVARLIDAAEKEQAERLASLPEGERAGGTVAKRRSVEMAQHREIWIEESLLRVCRGKPWAFARSDSGNVSSGMKSDHDQTIYAFERKDGEWVRNEALDGELIRLFEEDWAKEAEAGRRPHLHAVDVASIQGKNRFPDPRTVSVEDFSRMYEYTIKKLRQTPGAYTTYGAVYTQMQRRALKEILAGNRRSFMEYDPRAHREGAPPDAARLPFEPDRAIRVMFGIPPDLLPGHFFGVAVGNLIELEKYMDPRISEKFESKYHERPWTDAAYPIAAGISSGKDIEAYDRRLNRVVLERLFPGGSADFARKRMLHDIGLEISANLRRLHKGGEEISRITAGFPGAVPPADPFGRDRYVFDELGKALYGERWPNPAVALDAAETARVRKLLYEGLVPQHRDLAREFVLATIHAGFDEVARALDARRRGQLLSFEGYEHLMWRPRDMSDPAGPRREATPEERRRASENLHALIEAEFKYSTSVLGLLGTKRMIDEHARRFPETDWKNLYVQGAANWGLVRLDQANAFVQRLVLADLGYENVERAVTVNGLLETHEMTWNRKRLLRNMFYHPGTVASLAQVLRVNVESEGDPQRISLEILRQALYTPPVIGQVYALATGGPIQGFLMALVYVPKIGPLAGYGMVFATLCESGVAIYDVEFAQPAHTNAEDAVYRGFLGPELKSFEMNAAWSQEQQAELDAALAELKPLLLPGVAAPDERVVSLLARVEELQNLKEAMGRARVAAPWMGGFFIGARAQPKQKAFEHALLESIPFLVLHTPGGPVDFRAQFTGADQEELVSLEDWLKAAESGGSPVRTSDFLAKQGRRDELFDRREAYRRQLRYRARAAGAADAADQRSRFVEAVVGAGLATGREIAEIEQTEGAKGIRELAAALEARGRLTAPQAAIHLRHATIDGPELRHQIRRDSLHLAAGLTSGKEALVAGLLAKPEAFVAAWFAERKGLMEALARERLLGIPDFRAAGASPKSVTTPDAEIPFRAGPVFPPALRARLVERLTSDLERSRHLWEFHAAQTKHRAERAASMRAAAQRSYDLASLGQWLWSIDTDESLAPVREVRDDFVAAAKVAAVPNMPPLVESTVYLAQGGPGAPSAPAPGSRQASFGVRMRLDPGIYHPPYRHVMHLLGSREQVQAALTRGAVSGAGDDGKEQGVPLGADARRALVAALAEFDRARGPSAPPRGEDGDELLVAVVTSFAAGMGDLSSAVHQETVKHLPGYRPDGKPEGEVLIGQGVHRRRPKAPTTRELRYSGQFCDGGRIHAPNETLADGRKVLKSSSFVSIDLGTGTVGGTLVFDKQREPGSKATDRLKGSLFSHVPYNYKLPGAARGEVIVRGDARFEGADEEGPNVWVENFALALYRGDDVAIAGHPEFSKHFVVIFSGKPDRATLDKVLTSQRDALPPNVRAVLLSDEE